MVKIIQINNLKLIKLIAVYFILQLNLAYSSDLPMLKLPNDWVLSSGELVHLDGIQHYKRMYWLGERESYIYGRVRKEDELPLSYECLFPILNIRNNPLCLINLDESSNEFLNFYNLNKNEINIIGLKNDKINVSRIEIVEPKSIEREKGTYTIRAYQKNKKGKLNFIEIPCEFRGLGFEISKPNWAMITTLISCKKYNNLHFTDSSIYDSKSNRSVGKFSNDNTLISFPELKPLDESRFWFSADIRWYYKNNKHFKLLSFSVKNKAPKWEDRDEEGEQALITCPQLMKYSHNGWTIKASSGEERSTYCKVTRLQTISPEGLVKDYATLGKSFDELSEDDYMFEEEDDPVKGLIDIYSIKGQISDELGIYSYYRPHRDEEYVSPQLKELIIPYTSLIFPREGKKRCGSYRPINFDNSENPNQEPWVSEFGCFNPLIPVVKVTSGKGIGSAAILTDNNKKTWIAGVDHVGIEKLSVLYDSAFDTVNETLKANIVALNFSKNKFDPIWYQQIKTKKEGLDATRSKPLKQGEKIWISGYPGGKGPVDLRCIYSYGNKEIGIAFCHYLRLSIKDVNHWQKNKESQKDLYSRLNELLKGMSGGPVTDGNQKYLGSLSHSSPYILGHLSNDNADVLSHIIFQKHPSLNSKSKNWTKAIIPIENIGEEANRTGYANPKMFDFKEYSYYEDRYTKLITADKFFCDKFLKVYFDKMTGSKRKQLYSWLVNTNQACGE